MLLKPYVAHYNWDSGVAGVAMRAVAAWLRGCVAACGARTKNGG